MASSRGTLTIFMIIMMMMKVTFLITRAQLVGLSKWTLIRWSPVNVVFPTYFNSCQTKSISGFRKFTFHAVSIFNYSTIWFLALRPSVFQIWWYDKLCSRCISDWYRHPKCTWDISVGDKSPNSNDSLTVRRSIVDSRWTDQDTVAPCSNSCNYNLA